MALANVSLHALGSIAAQGGTPPMGVRSDRKYPRSERKLNPDWLMSYWQTDLPHLTTTRDWRCYLKERGYHYKSSDDLARLKELAKRCARGLQSYHAHDAKTIRALALSRGMDWQVRLNLSRQSLIGHLEARDESKVNLEASRTFHRFSKLPPELRNRIYGFYFESLGKVPPRFVVPPLCRVSRQMRLETTELFFEQSTFVISLRRVHGIQPPQLPYRFRARLHYNTEVAKSNVPRLSFAQIKHLHIELKASSNSTPLATWTIDLTDGRCVRDTPTNDKRDHEQTVQTLVDSIMACEGSAKFKKSDLDKLEIAITEAYAHLRH